MAAGVNPDPTKEEILEFLRKPNNAGKQMTAKEIAQAMGFQGGRNVNKQLYGPLLKQKLVVNDERVKPPVWWLPGPVNPPRQVLSGASPRGRSSESEILYKRTDTRDGTMILSPTTVEELTTEHPKPQPSASDPAQHRSERVCEHLPLRPLIDYPDDVLREPEPETQGPSNYIASPRNPDPPSPLLPPLCIPQPAAVFSSLDSVSESQTELAELSSHVSSRLSGVDNISTLSEELSQVSLQGCPWPDTQRADESSEPSERTPLVAPQHPVPRPRRLEPPRDDEREAVLQAINDAHSPVSCEQLSKQTGMQTIPPFILKSILNEFVKQKKIVTIRPDDDNEKELYWKLT